MLLKARIRNRWRCWATSSGNVTTTASADVVGKTHPTGPQELHHRRGSSAALHLGRWRRLSAAESLGRPQPEVSGRYQAEAGREPRRGQRGVPVAVRAICQGDTDSFSYRRFQGGGARTERSVREGTGEHAGAAAGRGWTATGDRLRQRFDFAAGPRHGAGARICGALGGGRQPGAHRAPTADGVAGTCR